MLDNIVKKFSGNIIPYQFDTRQALAKNLAFNLFTNLNNNLNIIGTADLALSGGNTPQLMLQELTKFNCHWPGVTAVTIDERWVPKNHPRSNFRMLKEQLVRNYSQSINLISIYCGEYKPEVALVEIKIRLKRIGKPFAACVIGMGTDGHTASLFSGADNLKDGLDMENTLGLIATQEPNSNEPRVSFAVPRILNTNQLYMHIEGEEKFKALEKAATSKDPFEMPIRSILNQNIVPIHLYWSK